MAVKITLEDKLNAIPERSPRETDSTPEIID
jgi:hypothetical protein